MRLILYGLIWVKRIHLFISYFERVFSARIVKHGAASKRKTNKKVAKDNAQSTSRGFEKGRLFDQRLFHVLD